MGSCICSATRLESMSGTLSGSSLKTTEPVLPYLDERGCDG